jgi:hypothetical protein
MYTPLVYFAMIIAAIGGMVLASRFSVEDRDKQLIDAWCRQPVIEKIHDGGRWSDEPVSLVYYEDCIKKKPDWWPKENQ